MPNYSHSYLQQFRDCPLSCRFKYELRLRKQEEDGSEHHMVYSRAFHEALRVLYLGASFGEVKDAFLNGYPTQLDINDSAKTIPNGIACLREYVIRWREEDKQYRVLAAEQMDKQEDGFVVKLDLVLQHKETEAILPLDHKVTGAYLNYKFWEHFEPNSQINEYVRFVKERYGYCDGFIVNAVALRFRQRAFKGEPAGVWFAFERQTFNPNSAQLDQALIDRKYWADRVDHARENDWWAQNTANCFRCEYRAICKAGWLWPQDEDLINISYRQVCGKWHGEPLQPCAMDRGHEGAHRSILPQVEAFEVTVEV